MAVQSNDRFMARAIEDSKSDAKEHQRCDAIEGYKPDAIIYRAKIPILNEDGSPNTAHSLNPVPIVVVSDRVAKVEDGILADVAPTVLKLMGLPQPAEMSGKALVELK